MNAEHKLVDQANYAKGRQRNQLLELTVGGATPISCRSNHRVQKKRRTGWWIINHIQRSNMARGRWINQFNLVQHINSIRIYLLLICPRTLFSETAKGGIEPAWFVGETLPPSHFELKLTCQYPRIAERLDSTGRLIKLQYPAPISGLDLGTYCNAYWGQMEVCSLIRHAPSMQGRSSIVERAVS